MSNKRRWYARLSSAYYPPTSPWTRARSVLRVDSGPRTRARSVLRVDSYQHGSIAVLLRLEREPDRPINLQLTHEEAKALGQELTRFAHEHPPERK